MFVVCRSDRHFQNLMAVIIIFMISKFLNNTAARKTWTSAKGGHLNSKQTNVSEKKLSIRNLTTYCENTHRTSPSVRSKGRPPAKRELTVNVRTCICKSAWHEQLTASINKPGVFITGCQCCDRQLWPEKGAEWQHPNKRTFTHARQMAIHGLKSSGKPMVTSF